MRPDLTPLCELALKYATDKGGWHLKAGDTCHNYTPSYFKIWDGKQNAVRNVLEIGVNYGCSLRMWRDFFPNARIIGLDSNAEALYNEDRIESYAADQGIAESLKGALAMCNFPRFDFIVDDGSHEDHHQVLSAEVLLPYLAKGGVYVIEDLRVDCDALNFANRIKGIEHYRVSVMNCGRGLGKAHCDAHCHRCHGTEGESLLVIRNG
jgi:hypothetical protein